MNAKNTKNLKKLELLAPAGSKEALVAAIKAGADSVYVGVDKYNARLNADRLNLYDLEVLSNYAHSQNKKIYFALNTLIKHEEIYAAAKTLERINTFKPDALILQDLGLARIIREEFPGLQLHASTQLSVHNSAGVEVLERLGFKRVILARELSSGELKQIASKSKIELEIFCHGALCFSVSGMCLFSSFIGSRSGNRGRCTQPCRRIWKMDRPLAGNGKSGYLFSPKDLELAGEIKLLRKTGIDSLKIEGRMRSSEYVYNVVSAYRMLLDSSEAELEKNIEEAKKMLAADWARSKTMLFFSGADSSLFNPGSAQCLGLNIGSVAKSDGASVTVQADCVLKEGDRIRIADPSTDRTVNIKLPHMHELSKESAFRFSCTDIFKAGSPVFKAGDADWDEKVLTKEVDTIYKSYNGKLRGDTKYKPLVYPNLIARQWNDKDAEVEERAPYSSKRVAWGTPMEEALWVKIDNPDWLEILPLNSKSNMIVLSLNRENMHAFRALADTLECHAADFSCELTPYISQKDFPAYEQAINALAGAGAKYWVLNNISHFSYFADDIPKVAGHYLYTENAFAARVYKDLGVKYFTASWEDDFLNIQRLAQAGLRSRLVVYLFGHPALSRSRMLSADYLAEGRITNRSNENFELKYESGSGVIIPETPVMNFTVRRKLVGLGIMNFGIDLNFVKPDKKKWKELYAAFLDLKNLEDTVKFNFKRGLE